MSLLVYQCRLCVDFTTVSLLIIRAMSIMSILFLNYNNNNNNNNNNYIYIYKGNFFRHFYYLIKCYSFDTN